MKIKDIQIEIQSNESVIEIDSKLSFVKIESKGFQDLCKRLGELEAKNQSLELENDFLQKELTEIKSMSMFEFGNTYCSDESLEADGHAFARSLLGKPMTNEDLAIEAAEDNYVPYTAEDF